MNRKYIIPYKNEEAILEPVTYTVREVVTKRWWWIDKEEYYIETEISRMGPLTREDMSFTVWILASTDPKAKIEFK